MGLFTQWKLTDQWVYDDRNMMTVAHDDDDHHHHHHHHHHE